MSDETFPIALGGKAWALPHLPFRAIKAIQPALYDIYVAAGGASMSSDGVARLGEKRARAPGRGDLARHLPCRSRTLLRRLPGTAVLGRRLDPGFPLGRQGSRIAAGSERDGGGVARGGKIDYDALIAGVVANLGWSWDEALDQLTVPRFLALQAEWRRHPPIHWLVAAALKYRPEGEAAARTQPTMAELKATFSNGTL